MSVIATVKVYDGIVLGAESMTQLTQNVNGQAQWVKSYENAQKLFQVANLPVGVLTYGGGNIGKRSIESFVHQFSRAEQARAQDRLVNNQPLESVDVEEISRRFFVFMNERHASAFGQIAREQQPVIGFIVAGYSQDQPLASEWEFILPNDTDIRRVRQQEEVGGSWRGVWAPFTRLLFGADPSLEQRLVTAGATPAEIQRFKTVMQQVGTVVAFDGMPLQDAIGFCRFIIQTTIGWCTYAIGAAMCGGPVKLAVITPGGGFEWISRPKYQPEGEKHAH